jgi:nitrate/nitrite-specific signal transduction histidine kinase
MYKVQRPKWVLAMSDVTEKYAKKRQSQTRTKREAQNWPEGGYAALSKLAKEMQVEVDHLEQKRMWNTRDLYHYQRYLIVLFYSKHALRGDLADVKIKKPLGENWLKKKGNIYEMHIGEHKTSRSHGSIQLKLGPQLSNALDVFVGQALRLQSHGYLLSTLRTRARLQRQDMLRLIRNIMRERLGKNIGVQLIRVLKVSAAAAEIDLAAALQKEMGHSAGMQKKYISR